MTIKYAKKAQILFAQAQANAGIPVVDKAPNTWAISTAYTVGDTVIGLGGKAYICITAGTSAGAGGPTTTVADITDGTVHWKFTTLLVSAWVTATAYVLNSVVSNGGNVYLCTTAGTSSSAPTGTGVGIVDGTCVWAKTGAFVAADAVAVFNSDFNTNLANETFQYSGSELDRDAGVTITDKFAEANAETFAPALSAITGAPSVANFPLAELFQAAGAAVSYSGNSSTSDAQVATDNATASNTLLTLEISKISSDRAAYQKNYKFYDCRAQVDLMIDAGRRANLKWHFKGNPVDALGMPYPVETSLVAPTYGTQKTIIAPSVKLASVVQAQLITYNSDGTIGTIPAAFSSAVKNIGFNKLSAPNLFGFDYARFLTLTEEGFAKSAVSTDVTLTILEDGIVGIGGNVWNPDASTSSGLLGAMLEGYFSLAIQWGTVLGQKVYVEFTKLQLMDVKGVDISSYHGKDLVFKNTGTTRLLFR